MKHSEQLNELFEALSVFQSKVSSVAFDAKVNVKTRTGSGYAFEYATLGALIDATKEDLAENGLSVTQILDGDGIITIIGHKSGQFISGNFSLPFNDSMDAQARGGVITYFRRYGYASALRLNSEKDDDANHASGNEATFVKEPKRSLSPTKKADTPKSPPKKSNDAILDTIEAFDDSSALVKWFNEQLSQMNESESEEFRDTYFPSVRDKLASLS